MGGEEDHAVSERDGLSGQDGPVLACAGEEMNEARTLLLGLIRGDTVTTAEIQEHLERLDRLGAELPKGWQSWPSELRAMEREGVVRLEGEGWWVFVPEKAKPVQASLF